MIGVVERCRRLGAIATLAAFGLAGCGSSGSSVAKPSPSPSNIVPVFGFDYSPYTGVTNDGPGAVEPDAKIEAHLKILQGKTTWIKIAGSSAGATNIPKIAHRMGFKICVGAYLSKDPKASADEVNQLKKDIDSGWVDLAMLGSESIWAGYRPFPELVTELDAMHAFIKGRVPLTTAEPDLVWTKYPDLSKHVDVVMANITPFSLEKPLEESLPYMMKSYSDLQQLTKKEVWIGESEWATEGGFHGKAFGSLANANKYFADVEHWARQNKVKMFYFEAFDEPWLNGVEPPFGGHWGVFTSDGVMKPGMEAGFTRP